MVNAMDPVKDESSFTILQNAQSSPPTDDFVHANYGEQNSFSGSDIANGSGDDSGSSWMQKIDVSGFKSLTASIAAGMQVQEHETREDLFQTFESRGDSIKQRLSEESCSSLLESHCASLPVTPLKSYHASQVCNSESKFIIASMTSESAQIPPQLKRLRSEPIFDNCSIGSAQLPQTSGIPQINIPQASSIPQTGGEREYPKPTFSYSCLIALSLKNSRTGRLQVSEIYNFMCENFPYFRTAPPGWKNSVRHNLSLNKCFEKVEIDSPAGQGRKACLWMLNPAKVVKMDQEIIKWRTKDPQGVIESLLNPEDLEAIEKGQKGMPTDATVMCPLIIPPTTLPDIIQHTQQALLYQQQQQGYVQNGLLGSTQLYGPDFFQNYNHPSGFTSQIYGAVVPTPSTPPHMLFQGATADFSPVLSHRASPNYMPQMRHSPRVEPYSTQPHGARSLVQTYPGSFTFHQHSPQMIHHHSPHASPAKYPSSPYKQHPIDAGTLNNNILAQGALAQSPCRSNLQRF